MCIFSQPIDRVSDTSIFARMIEGRQVLVYEMRVASCHDLAMVLPLPTRHAGEHAVSFVDLSEYPQFFDDMVRCFPRPLSRSTNAPVAAGAGDMLRVHRVGAFEASFVPGIVDFGRLDPRFRLPESVWAALPGYGDYGFAVFQLARGEARVHPMGMRFETRNPEAVYFPTTHVHDGMVHESAHFDHALYAQGVADASEWQLSSVMPRDVMKFGGVVRRDPTRGTVDSSARIRRRVLRGELPNGDLWLPVANSGAAAG
jgi:hypothetical protein